MNQLINDWLISINSVGETFWQYSSQIFVQSSILIVLLLIIDFLLRKGVRATLRYWMWMLVFVKLILPPTFSLPTGIGYWFGGFLSPTPVVSKEAPTVPIPETTTVMASEIPIQPAEISTIPSPETSIEPVAPTTPAGVHITPLTWKAIVFLLWLGGMGAFSVLLLRRIRFVRRLITQSTPAKNNLLKMLNQCRDELGISRSIQLRLSTGTPSPAACGLFRPIILMPASLPDKLSPERLRAVLIHELAHIKRGDLWINTAQTLLQVIYFYNPLLWLANAVVRRVREQAVDEMVLVTLGREAKGYSNTLIDIAEMAFAKPNLSLRLIGVVESRRALQGRIKHMINRPVPKNAKTGILGTAIVLLTAAVFLPMSRAEKQANAAETKPASRQFIARLPNGVTAELVGFCSGPDTKDSQWWRPDGTRMSEPSFEASRRVPPFASIPTQYIFLAKAAGGKDISVRMKICQGSGLSTRAASDGTALCYVRHPNPEKSYYKEAFVKGPVEIGVAQGPWLRARGPDSNMRSPRSYLIGSHDQIVIQPPRPESSSPETATTFWHTATSHDYEYRLTCTLKNGEVQEVMRPSFLHTETVESENTKRPKLTVESFNIDVPLDRIADYRLLYRKFDYVLFSNTAFKPGAKTNAKIEAEGPDAEAAETKTIIPGLRVGDYTLDMTKDDVLKKLGEPQAIQLGFEHVDVVRRGEERYSLDNLPSHSILYFGDISFWLEDGSGRVMIGVQSPLYKLSNGLGVGDSEQKIKQAFGEGFQLEEVLGKDFLCYHASGIGFEIHKKNQTVADIVVYKQEGNHDDVGARHQQGQSEHTRLIRQAAADGRISYKLTTPDEFKAIAGRPIREWTESNDEIIYMEYPGIRVRFFGKPELWPHTLVHISYEEGRIDIGQDRPITLRNEKDLDKFGTFWGYSSVDLSKLDLSQKGELLKKMPFDSRTVWPKSDRLPPDFDPDAVMKWSKYPGLGIKQLHDQGVTGKGIHVAIIDQPLLLDHIEYKDQLVSYKEIETGNVEPQMHGPPVASILVGKTCGVAPGAILHYWAEPSWKGDYKYRCIALEQIIQFNNGKEKSEQIRVVSVSKGFSPGEPNLDKWKALLAKAKKAGIYIVHCSSMGFGAGCRYLKDSDNPANYRLCSFYEGGDVYRQSGTFFTPIDHRTIASHRAKDAYTFWTRGGLSWGAPYYAGVVALGIQVNPNLRPDQIDKLLYDSGWDFQRGKLINPVGFVEAARTAGSD